MPYGFIVSIASVALVAYFDFATEASWITKTVVSGIFFICLAAFFGWIAVNHLLALFLLVALNIFIIIYRTVEKTQSSIRR